MSTIDLIAATAFGLESVVARELEELGYQPRILSTGRVLFEGDFLALARANTWLRAADRVLVRIAEFPAADFDQLFEGVKALPWEEWISREHAFPVDGRCVRSLLTSVPAVQRATKKAIVERLGSKYGLTTLPETGAEVRVEVSILNDVATLTIDSSGDGLHKRGYRKLIGDAQLKETLAAGLVLLSVWNRERPLIDPFCGSGTIPIEAAMIGRNIAPGLYRSFAAVDWGMISDEVWDQVDQEARDIEQPKLAYDIHGFDISEEQLSLARFHAKRAGVQDCIRFANRNFLDLTSKLEYGVTIMNPPYGDRVGIGREIEQLYRAFPTVLRRLPTWSHHVLTSWDDFEALVGQRATRRRKLYNAQIECQYFQFLGPRPPENMPTREMPAVDESFAGVGSDPDVVPGVEPMPEQAEEPAEQEVSHEEEAAPEQPAAEPIAASFGGLRSRDVKEIEEFRACLTNNVRHLRKYPSRGITCYRVYERDAPDVPVIIDVYEDTAHVAEYEREHGRTAAQHTDWLERCGEVTAEVLGIDTRRVIVKRKHRQREGTQHEKVSEEGKTIVVNEGGLRFEVNLSDYIDTGLFLDHRLTRQMVRERSAGKRFLNLFCYTGSFTVYAAAGGAAATTSVDLSKTYLRWAGRNLELNGQEWWGEDVRDHAPPPENGNRLVFGDVMAFLRDHEPGEWYDLIVIDPPTFSTSNRTEDVFDVQRDHGELLGLAAGLLSQGGEIFFSNNNRRFKFDEAVLARAEETGFQIREISNRTVPPEYRNTRIHRCWRIARGSSE